MTKEEAIRNINALNAVCGQKPFYDNEFEEALGMAVEALENQKTGHWIFDFGEKESGIYKCSECGRVIMKYSDENLSENYPYCHCGAKMESEDKK